MNNEVEFTVKCKMQKEQAKYFIAFLKTMESLGQVGSSRRLCFVSDGDGDYKPNFDFSHIENIDYKNVTVLQEDIAIDNAIEIKATDWNEVVSRIDNHYPFYTQDYTFYI